MTFTTPILLLALIPWAAVAAWLLMNRRVSNSVPFLDLWRGASDAPRMSRRFHPPPLPLLSLLLSALFAILAAAGIMLTFVHASGARTVTVIVDRGITMSAAQRRDETIEAARAALLEQFG